MGIGVIRRLSAAAVLAAGILGGTAIITTEASQAHTCVRVTLKHPTTIHVVPDPTCTDHHNLNDPGSCTVMTPKVLMTEMAEAVVCVSL